MRLSIFKEPPPETKIWRYIDFTKFVSLLSNRSLYFTRMDLLDDEFEGSLPKFYKPKSAPRGRKLFKEIYGEDYDEQIKTIREAERRLGKASTRLHKARRRLFYVNSWHMNEQESAAMWKLYLRSGDGVAIQSTFKRLSDSIIERKNVGFSMMYYVDNYRKDARDVTNLDYNTALFPYLFKRKCFEYEKELRALSFAPIPKIEQGKIPLFYKLSFRGVPEGLNIAVDLPTLIEKIYVSPYAQTWFADLVKSVIGKYGFQSEVVPSSLADKPTF